MQYLNSVFWFDIEQTFPEEFAAWTNWIREYAQSKAWTDVIVQGMTFNHLPFEMQTGILYKYMRESMEVTMIGMFDVTDQEETVATVRDLFAHCFMRRLEMEAKEEERLSIEQLRKADSTG